MHIRSCKLLFATALVASLVSLPANAGLFRAYLSASGADSNPCTAQLPCRLLPAALAAVNSGGEIWMLDSANYNTATVNIGKSVSIMAVPGAVGSVLAISGPAIMITTNGLTVALRNLVVAPLPGGGGNDGIWMTGTSSLTIEESVVANLPGIGINVTAGGRVRIANSVVRNNSGYAVIMQGGTRGILESVTMFGNALGGVYGWSASASAVTQITMSDSAVSGGTTAAKAQASAGTVKITITRCTLDDVGYALDSEAEAGSTTEVSVNGSTISNSGYAWRVAGDGDARIYTSGNNHFTNNTTSLGSMLPLSLQ
jgi:hypothetical protein